MFYYNAHGLNICSELYFPELIEEDPGNKFDVSIKFGFDYFPNQNINKLNFNNFIEVSLNSNRITLFWKEECACTIINGKKILINPTHNIGEDLIRLIILGHVLAIILHLKGRLILHANAVNINNGAVIFLGSSGKGKSTTSLALHKKGYNLLSDDILSIKIDKDNQPIVFPSFPRIKLWPEVIENLNENPYSMPKLHLDTEKRSYFIEDNFLDIPIPLKSIYLIKDSNKVGINQIKSQKALMEIVKSSYCYPIFDNDKVSENLNQCAKILKKVPVKVLKIKKSFANIPKIVEIVEKDININ